MVNKLIQLNHFNHMNLNLQNLQIFLKHYHKILNMEIHHNKLVLINYKIVHLISLKVKIMISDSNNEIGLVI